MRQNMKASVFKLGHSSQTVRKLIYKFRISRKWKYRLSSREIREGEEALIYKKKLVKKHLKRHPLDYQRLVNSCKKQFPEFLSKDQRKHHHYMQKLMMDMLFCHMAYGTSMDEYFLFDFEHISCDKRKAYITDLNRYEYYYWLDDPYEEKILFDKYKTWEIFRTYMGRDMLKITSETSKEEVERFILKHGEFVKKPLDQSRGEGVVLYQISDYGDAGRVSQELCNGQACILEERIQQSAGMGILHPESVNTIRCSTVYTPDGGVLFYPVLRMGRGSSFVDNAAAGGIIANIDAKTGLVVTNGVDEKGGRYEVHPDTKLTIKGFQVPEWESLVLFAKEISAVLPRTRYVGWDLALTDKGWVMIEGNCHGQFLCEYVDKAGRKAELDALMSLIQTSV